MLPVALLVVSSALADTLHVGPDRKFASPAEALAAAKPGDTILIHPRADGKPWEGVALRVTIPKLTISCLPSVHPVVLSGAGFDYSGQGAVPRAIIQFDPEASGGVVENLELKDARNQTHNAAGVRINQASRVTVRGCRISGNDMGIMSNGLLKDKTAADQLIEGCVITANGSDKEPGYNHNLYLGGTSVTVRGCEISNSTTGHNVKSRAHITLIEYNHIHDAANLEIDLVDEKGNTDAPQSDAIILGNFIDKAKDCKGNRGVIHFGKDGKADRTGCAFIALNTIRTPFVSPVVSLNAPGASLRFDDNVVLDRGDKQRGVLVQLEGPTVESTAGGGNRWPDAFTGRQRIDAGDPIAWEDLHLRWPDGKRPPLKEYRGPGNVVDRKPAVTGAGELLK